MNNEKILPTVINPTVFFILFLFFLFLVSAIIVVHRKFLIIAQSETYHSMRNITM